MFSSGTEVWNTDFIFKDNILPFVQHICLAHALKYGNFQQPFEHLKRHKPATELN